MSDLRIGDRVYRAGNIRRIGTITSFATTSIGRGRKRKWLHFVHVVITTSRGQVRKTWKRREVRLAD